MHANVELFSCLLWFNLVSVFAVLSTNVLSLFQVKRCHSTPVSISIRFFEIRCESCSLVDVIHGTHIDVKHTVGTKVTSHFPRMKNEEK